MKTLKIQIPNMQSSHCQVRVSNVLKTTQDLKILSIKPGMAEVEIQNPEVQQDMIRLIENAGYTVAGIQTESNTSGEDEISFQFKTNINCSGCVAAVTKEFKEEQGIAKWNVDLASDDKILTVNSNGISKQGLIEAVQKAGFNIEAINS